MLKLRQGSSRGVLQPVQAGMAEEGMRAGKENTGNEKLPPVHSCSSLAAWVTGCSPLPCGAGDVLSAPCTELSPKCSEHEPFCACWEQSSLPEGTG